MNAIRFYLFNFNILLLTVNDLFSPLGEDIWRYVGKLTDAQKSMLDDSLNGRLVYI